MIRVAILMDHPSPHMAELLSALAERADAAVRVVYLRGTARERTWGSPLGALPSSFADPGSRRPGTLNVAGAMSRVRAARADVWVVNSVYTTPETWAVTRWLGARGLPWVYMNENLRFREGIDAMKERLVRGLLAGSSGVIGMGAAAENRYAALAPAGTPSVSVPYYLDLDPFRALPLPSQPGAGEPVRFLLVARMIAGKGHEDLAAACGRLPREGWTLTLAGDGPLRTKVERAFQVPGVRERVRFLGEVPYASRSSAFQGQHVFVFPSHWDGWGVAPLEAMAAGLPVVSTDRVMSMRETIQEGVNGHLVPHGSPGALAERMQAFLLDPGRIARMGSAARASLDGYRPREGAARLVQFLEQVVEARARPRGTGAMALASPGPRPTWKQLTTPASLGARARRDARALAKQAAIRVSSAVAPGLWRPRGSRVLVYHLVLREDRRRFDEHLRFLTDHYQVVTAARLIDEVAAGSNGPFAAVSFDDAFEELLHDALEIMDLRGVKGTFFVPTGFVDLAGSPEAAARFSLGAHYYEKPLRPMKAADVRRLHALGHEIGSHGVSHLDLGAVSHALAARELAGSRERLREWLGVAPTGFAYPYGALESSVGDPPEWVEAAGFTYAVTLKRGAISFGTNRLRVPREHVEGSWSARDLRYFLAR